MSHLLLVYFPIFASFIFSIILLIERWNKPVIRILALALLLFSIAECNYIFYYEFDYRSFYISDILNTFILLLIFPLLTFFFNKLARGSVPKWELWLLFTPSVIFCALSIWLYAILGDQTETYIKQYYYGTSTHFDLSKSSLVYTLHIINYYVFTIVLLCQAIGFLIDSWRQLLFYDRQIYKYYSNDTDIATSDFLRICFVAIIAVGIINIFVHRKDLPPYLLDFFQIFYGVAGLIIGIYALRIRYTADNFIDEKDKEIKAIEEEEKASEKILIDDNNAEQAYRKNLNDLYMRFIQQMENEKLFLKKNLSLSDISLQLRTNRTYMSEAINIQKEGKTFSYIVNNYRLGYARALLYKQPDSDLEFVALESGFSSYTSFYRACRNILNINPQNLRPRPQTVQA